MTSPAAWGTTRSVPWTGASMKALRRGPTPWGALAAGAVDDAAADGPAAGAAGTDPADAGGSAGATSVARSTGAIASAIGSQRTLAWSPLGSALRSSIVNGTPRLTVDPAELTLAISRVARVRPVPLSAVARGAAGRPETVSAWIG